MNVRVDPRSDIPPSRQIIDTILDAVSRGELGSGDRLPSVRGLAEEALVNPNTVGKAYRDLEVLGVVEGRNGSGVYVTDLGPEIASEARRRSTLDTFRRAATEALRAGHDVDELTAALDAQVPKRLLVAHDGEEA